MKDYLNKPKSKNKSNEVHLNSIVLILPKRRLMDNLTRLLSDQTSSSESCIFCLVVLKTIPHSSVSPELGKPQLLKGLHSALWENKFRKVFLVNAYYSLIFQ